MQFWHNLRRLARHHKFRKLLAVRVVTQASDGTLQVGMASYVLFSPQSQPNAWAIAAVLAITLLPFSVIGPFVSVVLDRWSRQRVAMWTDSVRGLIAIALGALIVTGDRGPAVQTTLYILLLVAMSLNRFLMAGLSAGLPHTIDRDEFLLASSVMPVVGPLGVLIGGVIAGAIRLLFTPEPFTSYQADALVFAISAGLFVVSVALSSRFGKHDLGPDPAERAHVRTVAEIARGLRDAFTHLGEQGPAALSLGVIGVARLLFGVWTVAMLLAWRNHFHEVGQVKGAIGDVGIWGGATGVGFVMSAALVPALAARVGLRKTVAVLVAASGVAMMVPGAFFGTKIALYVAGFLIGWFAQSLKICVDTTFQAHVTDFYKGRAFVIYDVVFNAALVAAAVIGALVLPADGVSVPVFVGVALSYAFVAVAFWVRSRRFGDEGFNHGTHFEAPATV